MNVKEFTELMATMLRISPSAVFAGFRSTGCSLAVAGDNFWAKD